MRKTLLSTVALLLLFNAATGATSPSFAKSKEREIAAVTVPSLESQTVGSYVPERPIAQTPTEAPAGQLSQASTPRVGLLSQLRPEDVDFWEVVLVAFLVVEVAFVNFKP